MTCPKQKSEPLLLEMEGIQSTLVWAFVGSLEGSLGMKEIKRNVRDL